MDSEAWWWSEGSVKSLMPSVYDVMCVVKSWQSEWRPVTVEPTVYDLWAVAGEPVKAGRAWAGDQ